MHNIINNNEHSNKTQMNCVVLGVCVFVCVCVRVVSLLCATFNHHVRIKEIDEVTK